MKKGRKACEIRSAWSERFNLKLNGHQRNNHLPDKMMHQLSHCKSDEARRLILGISEEV